MYLFMILLSYNQSIHLFNPSMIYPTTSPSSIHHIPTLLPSAPYSYTCPRFLTYAEEVNCNG